jgi:hypothetical protein
MNPIKTIMCALAILCGIGTCAIAQDDDLYYGGFDGRWEGAMAHVPLQQFDVPNVNYAPVEYAFSITGQDVKVYEKLNGVWQERKLGGFRLVQFKTNAIIVSITASSDIKDQTGSGGWVETLNFTITHKDRDGLYVSLTRAVNNYLHAYDDKSADGVPLGRFVNVLYGEMDRVPAPAP